MVRFLLQNGADPRGSSKSGPAICRAVSNKNLETVKALLEHHADVNDYGSGGYSALHDVGTHFWVNDPTGESGEPPSVTMTKVLLEAGADINACMEMENFTPVHIHLKRHTEVLETILDAKPDLEIKTSPTCYIPGMTPLALAVWEEKVEAAKILLAAGADPNTKTGHKGGAPLHLGMKEDLVRALLEYDPDLHLENDEGETPLNALLSLTREEKKDEWVVVGEVYAPDKETGITLPVIEMLLRKGSDVNYPNKAGQTPLFKALNKPDLAIARLLLSRGANPNHISREDGMPLHSACRSGTWEAFRLIFDKVGFAEKALYGIGSVVNATCMRDGGEEVPLQILKHLRKTVGRQKMHLNQKCGSYGCALSSACFWSSEGVIGWLLKHGARVRTKDHAGRRPIHFAAYRNTSIFSQICEAGGDITARDKIGRDNWAPLHYALLLDDDICSARDFKVRGHEDENWSILRLAWYHGAKAEIRRMLETSLKKQQGRHYWDTIGPEFTEEEDYMEEDESTNEDEPMGEDGEDDDESMEEDVEYDEDHSMEDDSDTDDSGSEDEL
ncbi:Ankyrin repeat protein [Lasiodiplodia theobromae]|uniref:Ankyrin repeat protein n=1 Tax=Lasiodiplodia theobromae TaxID=45133 RepID=UPI0015C3144C|nr:Ankyrin repeat protein [Lasiodiplodia theobromae]KAF4537790.1 Ankyrin repeat protein [Lasiodiplodia theobromae]